MNSATNQNGILLVLTHGDFILFHLALTKWKVPGLCRAARRLLFGPGVLRAAAGLGHGAHLSGGVLRDELHHAPWRSRGGYLPLAEMNIFCYFPPVRFKGNRFHYWTFFFWGGLSKWQLPSTWKCTNPESRLRGVCALPCSSGG